MRHLFVLLALLGVGGVVFGIARILQNVPGQAGPLPFRFEPPRRVSGTNTAIAKSQHCAVNRHRMNASTLRLSHVHPLTA